MPDRKVAFFINIEKELYFEMTIKGSIGKSVVIVILAGCRDTRDCPKSSTEYIFSPGGCIERIKNLRGSLFSQEIGIKKRKIS